MVVEILRKIGLCEGEIKVYSSLLGLGSAPMNRIHERTGIERRNIYDILNKLIERGLVTYVSENKKRYFKIAHPTNLVGYIEQKEHDLETLKAEMKQQIPSLTKQFEFVKPAINAEIFRGAEGVKAVWEDMLNYDSICWIGSGRYIPKWYPHFFASWDKRRINLKIKMFNLMRHELRKEIKASYKLEYIRFLPPEFSGAPTVIGIYGNKVVNFILSKEFFAFVIESKELADNYKNYHKYLWNNVAKK